METRKVGSGSGISGKDIHEVRGDIVRNIIRMKSRLRVKFDEIYDHSSMDHVRTLLRELSESEGNDIEELKKSAEEGIALAEPEIVAHADDYETYDHLLEEEPEIDSNDLKSILMTCIKYFGDISRILHLMETEYVDPTIRGTISALETRELTYKKKVEEILEERVNRDYW